MELERWLTGRGRNHGFSFPVELFVVAAFRCTICAVVRRASPTPRDKSMHGGGNRPSDDQIGCAVHSLPGARVLRAG